MKDPRMIIGCILVVGLIGLAYMTAAGKVTKDESFGLEPLVLVLGSLVLKFGDHVWKKDKDE